MTTAQQVFAQVLKATGCPFDAIRTVRMQFGLSLPEAKEFWLEATKVASSLSQHQILAVEEAFRENKL